MIMWNIFLGSFGLYIVNAQSAGKGDATISTEASNARACRDRNEEFTTCHSSSCWEGTCVNGVEVTPGPRCTLDCRRGCRCKDGYFRDPRRGCVRSCRGKAKGKGKDGDCGQHEEWTDCQSSSCFESRCVNGQVENPTVCTADCRSGCRCKDGFSRTSNQICIPNGQCNSNDSTNPQCPPVMCALFCEHGFKKNARGCEICECEPAPSPTPKCGPVCAIFCPNGHKKDANGCDLCECNPAGSPTPCGPVCAIFCPNGNKKDANGCDLCECNPPTPGGLTGISGPFGKAKGKAPTLTPATMPTAKGKSPTIPAITTASDVTLTTSPPTFGVSTR